MDGSRFDALTRSLGAQRNRRGVLGALAGAALASIGLGGAADAASCRGVGNACTTNGNCCSGNCVEDSRNRKTCHCSTPADCPAAPNACFTQGACSGGACAAAAYNGNGAACPGGVCFNNACCSPATTTKTCSGKCGSQTNNCGQTVDCGSCCNATGAACSSDSVCCSGVCVGGVCAAGKGSAGAGCDSAVDCGSGMSCCGSICINTATGVGNCGSCGNVCTVPNGVAGCAGGVCTVASCNAGYKNCDGFASTGCEVNVQSDSNNCGSCGHVCAVAHGAATCASGACVIDHCDAGYADCGGGAANGCETNLGTDVNNCGACGQVCPAPAHGSATCASGACGIACGSGYTVCDGVCKRATNQTCSADGDCCSGACDQGHCLAGPLGTGATCDSIADCLSGVCCRGICADQASFQTDPNNCGACQTVCPGGICLNGACPSCNPGTTRACYDGDPATRNVGVCTDGVQTCLSGGSGYGSCVGQTLPGVEVCNGLDDNCDGVQDDGDPGGGGPCDTGHLGVCAAGVKHCQGGQLVCVQTVQPSAEICDGLDNDCDGNIDNGASATCPARANATAACTGGDCTYVCDAGFSDCDQLSSTGCEINIRTDVNNCGACGLACPAPVHGVANCGAGVCGISCDTGYISCDGLCKRGPIQTCAADAECCSGACDQGYCLFGPLTEGAICDSAADCTTGECCRNACTDPASYATDPNNCGSCRTVCPSGGGCLDGICTYCVPGSTRACFDGARINRHIGACKDGVETCLSDGSDYGDCLGQVLPASSETCNGIDDTCNGTVDEGNPGGGLSCDTGKLGICAPGTTACVSGAIVCQQNEQPRAETCNGIDEDCDGQADNGNPGGGLACNTGKQGVCAAGTTACQNGVIVCNQNVQPSAEICDGLDNDCDGVVDNGNPGGGVPCNTGKQGVCATGATACQGGAIGCTQTVQPSAEICDGLDNDCDGFVDNNAYCPPGVNSSGVCTGNGCVYTCNAGFGNCDGNPGNGCEINLQTDARNCGSCGHVCNSTNGNATCSGGVCGISCNSGYGNCDGNPATGCEVNENDDANNCGYCGNVCPSNDYGQTSCSSGYQCCGESGAGYICCQFGYRPITTQYYCGSYQCDCYQVSYSCGAFHKDTCYDTYCYTCDNYCTGATCGY